MAVLALGLVGASLGATATIGATVVNIGLIAGSAIGAAIDSSFLFPAIFPPEDVVGPRLNELRIQSAEEGAPGNFLAGPDNRVAPTIIWLSDLIETVRTRGGGKGGGGPRVTSYSYAVSLAAAYAVGETQSVKKVTADGKTIYDSDPDVTITSNQLSVSTILNPSAAALYFGQCDIISPFGGPDLRELISGVDVVISGFANAANNGTFRVVSSSRDAATGQSRARIFNSSAINEAAGASVTLHQSIMNFQPSKLTSITFYAGTEIQGVDSVISAYEDPTGIGNVPAFRGISYCVIEGLTLAPYGNRIPQLTFFVEADASGDLGAVIQKVLTRNANSPSVDVSLVSDTIRGYALPGTHSTAKALQPLLVAGDLLDQEDDSGGVKIFPRSKARVIRVDPLDLGTVEDGAEPTTPVELQDPPNEPLPETVTVRYVDYEAADQSGSQIVRSRLADSDGDFAVDLPINLTGGAVQANAIAKRILWTIFANRQTVRITLPIWYLRIQENDIVEFTALSRRFFLLVHKIDIGNNYKMELECSVEVRSVLSQIGAAESPTSVSPGQFMPPEVIGDIVNGAGSGMTPAPGPAGGGSGVGGVGSGSTILFGMALPDTKSIFQGGVLFWSDDDTDFVPLADITEEATIGYSVQLLASIADTSTFDLVNTIDVELVQGFLTSVTEIQCLNGFNRMFIGGELIGFQNATLIGTNRYRLSKLLRGLLGSSTSHPGSNVTELCLFLNDSGVFAIQLPHSSISKTRYFRFVPAGGDVEEYTSFPLTISGEDLRPLPPAHPEYERSGSDVIISWFRQTRALVTLFSEEEVPLAEDFERYKVLIYDSGGTTLLRTIVVNNEEEATYTSTQQTADGLTAGSSAFSFKVLQVSGSVGDGTTTDLIAVSGV